MRELTTLLLIVSVLGCSGEEPPADESTETVPSTSTVNPAFIKKPAQGEDLVASPDKPIETPLQSTSEKNPGALDKPTDTVAGAELLTLTGHGGDVFSVTFSPDGERLASASRDGTIKVWDAATGEESLTLNGHDGVVRGVAFSSDGKQLASASWDATVKIWDAATGQELLTDRTHRPGQ